MARNPITKRTRLRQFPAWEVREYKDGTFDAAVLHGVGITRLADTFHEAVAMVREQEAAR